MEPAETANLLRDPPWWAQEKFDGRRIPIRRSGDTVTDINRRGLVVALPDPAARAAAVLGSLQWVIDGESLGDRFVAFELLESACTDLRPRPYTKRLAILAAMVRAVSGPAIRLIETATTTHATSKLTRVAACTSPCCAGRARILRRPIDRDQLLFGRIRAALVVLGVCEFGTWEYGGG